MILTISSVGANGRVVLGSWHIAADAKVQIQRDEATYPTGYQYKATGRRELIQLPPPTWDQEER